MKKYIIVALALVAGASLSVMDGRMPRKPIRLKLTTSSDSVSYAAGYVLADIVRDRFLGGLANDMKDTPDSIQMQLAYKGLMDALRNDTSYFKTQGAEQYLNARVTAAHKAKEEQQQQAGKAFLAENAKKPGVITLPSGLQYKVLKEGSGPVAKAADKVKVKYEGRLIDGTVFDSTEKPGGQPATFSPGQVIKGWTEALTMMPTGSKWQLFIPQELGYGARAAGSIPPYSTLIFDVEVLEVIPEK